MLDGIALRSALTDLVEFGYVHLEDIAHGLQLLELVPEEHELASTEFGWVVRIT